MFDESARPDQDFLIPISHAEAILQTIALSSSPDVNT